MTIISIEVILADAFAAHTQTLVLTRWFTTSLWLLCVGNEVAKKNVYKSFRVSCIHNFCFYGECIESCTHKYLWAVIGSQPLSSSSLLVLEMRLQRNIICIQMLGYHSQRLCLWRMEGASNHVSTNTYG